MDPVIAILRRVLIVALQYQRRTILSTTVAAATVVNATFSVAVTRAFELTATVRNAFNQQYADPASDEHLVDAIQQNGRTARIGVGWKLWAR